MLFDLALLKILKLKDWLENGDDSPYQVWKLAQGEIAVRNLIAGWLRQQSNHKYVISQENELLLFDIFVEEFEKFMGEIYLLYT